MISYWSSFIEDICFRLNDLLKSAELSVCHTDNNEQNKQIVRGEKVNLAFAPIIADVDSLYPPKLPAYASALV